jgi:SAM-dependent methyltransferase
MRLNLRYRRIEKFIQPSDGSRLIDVGGGTGNFARLCVQRGWQVAATEMDSTVVENLRTQGIDAYTPDDALSQPWDGAFDVATVWHVLEHVPDPQTTLNWISQILSPGGILHVSVPEFASFQSWISGKQWLHLDVPRHLWHFTHAALVPMLDRAGFDVVSRNTVVIEYDWFGFIQSTLNLITTRPNVLFDRLIHGSNTPDTPRSDIVLSLLLAPVLAAKSLPVVMTTGLLRMGATLDLVCRKRSD